MSHARESRASFKRSSSLSHIPTLRRDSKTTRTKSVSRPEAATRKTRNPSLDRKVQRSSSSLSTANRCTPLIGQSTLKTSRTTPSGSSAQKSSFGRVSSASKYSSLQTGRSPYKASAVKKERPVNDKKWVGEQYVKVRKYLEENPACDPNILNNLKPPTLNTFVYVSNILFKEIDPRIDITMADYKEKILALLKMLHFPGTVSNSLLKTVNTMHAWPQVMSIFSWLIDLLIFIHEDVEKKLDDESEIKEVIKDFFLERYNLFNAYGEECSDEDSEKCNRRKEECTECDKNFVLRLEEVLNIDKGKLEQLREHVPQLKLLKEDKAAQIAKSIAEANVLQNEIEEMKEQIEKFYTEDPLIEQKEENEIMLLAQRRQKILASLNEVKNNIINLKEVIMKQPCTFNEKKKLLEEIEDMKYTLELKKEKLEKWEQIKVQYDYKLMDLKRKVEGEVYRLNTALMQLAVMNPEMKVLKLRDKGFHQAVFKDEIDECVETKARIENKITENISKTKCNIDSIQVGKIELCNTINALQEVTEKLTKARIVLENKIKALEDDCVYVVAKCEELRSEYQVSILELKSKEPNIEELELEIQEFNVKKSADEIEFIKFQNNSLKFLKDLHVIAVNSIKEINDIQRNIVNKINKAHEDCDLYEEILYTKWKELKNMFNNAKAHLR